MKRTKYLTTLIFKFEINETINKSLYGKCYNILHITFRCGMLELNYPSATESTYQLEETLSLLYEPMREKTNNLSSDQPDTNRSVQSQKQPRDLKFRI